ncbi:MFS transporter [Xylophilus sp. GOD-11R]|uniref:MFS transporter n=1 Tax=Xylophilus sp. GOD-11R TaxID=3089814 RepID=UPI00298D4432|nr:MFS transporter [Xylophilus sp. GOD-11R]WPB55590.1 MFS transporter [Xylophilus sp. GOD-11R]
MRTSAHPEADRRSAMAALAMTAGAPGDALLYLLLPLYASDFGLTLPEVGLLLAANRLVRIAGYGWVARFYAERGDRPTLTGALVAASACCLVYGTLSGMWLLIGARLVWGLCFGAFNLSTQALAVEEPLGAARRAGISRALTALGPMVALPLGAWVTLMAGPRAIFFVAAIGALCGLLASRAIPVQARRFALPPIRRFTLPTGLDAWAFVEGMVLDGVFLIGLTYLARASGLESPLLAAALLMSARYVTEIVLSPAGGHAATRWGAERMLLVLSLCTALGLVAFGAGWLVSGALAILSLRALQLPLLPVIVGQRFPGPDRVQALVARSLWRDIGAGAGPLVAGLLLPIWPALTIYCFAAGLMAVATVMAVMPVRPAEAERQPGTPGRPG